MVKNLNPYFKALTWKEARSSVQKVNPALMKVIDKIDPGDDCLLYRAQYPYGVQVLRLGEFFLPCGENGELVSFNSPKIDPKLRQDLGYNLGSNPLMLVLNNAFEMYVSLEDRVVPFSLYKAGRMVGLWRMLDELTHQRLSHASVFIWDMTAGARSVFMLPKISEAIAHNKLKQAFHISVDKPKSALGHWRVFREISSHPEFTEQWHADTLLFSRAWFDHLQDPAWAELRTYLLEQAWQATEFWRNQFLWNLTFSRVQTLRNIKAAPYIADIVRHIFAMSSSAVPGFRPALDSSLAPIQGIQQAYIDHYELKSYQPIIMQPSFAAAEGRDDPIYYSLHFQTALELSPKSSERSSTISDLYDVRTLANKYVSEIIHRRLNIEATPLFELVQQIELNYFHSNVELYEGMRDSSEMVDLDPNFKKAAGKYSQREFPKNSSFVKGAVSVTYKN
jgi:hypothetical protein